MYVSPLEINAKCTLLCMCTLYISYIIMYACVNISVEVVGSHAFMASIVLAI